MEKEGMTQKQKPDVVVGGHKMSFDEYTEMMQDMEKEQVPFRAWLLEEMLPAYKKFLEEKFSKSTQEKHHSIANVLCDQILMAGFVSPEHVHPDFLYYDFPVWWQTHVMFGNYTEKTVENSVSAFVDFVAEKTGVRMDLEYVPSDDVFLS
jgi:hypothetical protein